jgi:TM2 domain-containing membrane protein YozV
MTNTATKAACLSAFIFPGCGHFYLKCYLRGVIFMAIAIFALIIIMQTVFAIAFDIAQDIERGVIPFSLDIIFNLVKEALAIYEDPDLIKAKIAMVASWAVSSIDAYRVGRSRIKENKNERKN